MLAIYFHYNPNTMQALYQIALTAHIIGLSTMAGATLADYVVMKGLWRSINNRPKAIAINETRLRFPVLFAAGITLLILSGVTMMGIARGTFGAQLWFKIKLVLIIFIIINGAVVARRQGARLTKLLSGETTHNDYTADVRKVRTVLTWYHLSQIASFALIFTLSVFKFN